MANLAKGKMLLLRFCRWPLFHSSRSVYIGCCSMKIFQPSFCLHADGNLMPQIQLIHSKKLSLDTQVEPVPRVVAVEPEPNRSIVGLSPEDEKRLKVLRLEYDVFYSSGVRVPDTVSDEDWLTLLYDCKTISARKRYYNYLFKTEKRILTKIARRQKNAVLHEAKREATKLANEDELLSFKNTFLIRIQESTMNRWYYNNLCYALINGPHLVFDFSYESRMTEQELNSLMFQLQLCHHLNKVSREPFYFNFCNVIPQSKIQQKLDLALLQDKVKTVVNVTDQHYTECFPKSRLVYLSPNAPTAMSKFDTDDVYVIGGIVDKAVEHPLTLARAKQEKLRTVRLPIDEHIKWVNGSKSLTLNTVVGILLDFRRTGDWTTSFMNNIPARCFDANYIPRKKLTKRT